MNSNLTFLNNYLGFKRPQDRLYTALDLFEEQEQLDTIQHKSGIYIIMSPTQKFVYPRGTSSRYNYIYAYGGRVYYMLTQGRETNKALESKALEGFYDKFGALPVGNGAFSFR